ncbi:voltage-dependent calcium channel subunit alpha-2/delta-3 isoform X2 [Phymastichus coffea]|uniref:voltage-dependent calcium channel subunit alpha-2/delta-3 isoform X2 n=1 Tax=Phymastichus coffea TaxID=108790 RepID=UPI00273AD8ED|nr:voltage-dependent calcium channel subunit alpha-2/delta-3 isoform X2 [Phymastichus coffea]
MLSSRLALLPILLALGSALGRAEDSIDLNTVQAWSSKIGFELNEVGRYLINIERFQKSYKDATIKVVEGKTIVQSIAAEIEKMLDSKVEAIKRIMDVAQAKAKSAYDSEVVREPPDAEYEYKDVKNYTTITTTYNEHFDETVNLNYSAIHVPTTVYGRDKNVLPAIRWSEELDETFKNNYRQDPSLSWQYFGSSTGFMRLYPATQWTPNGSDCHDPDLYDCRTRSWYIEAATSPKDVLILVDISGSMTGMRKEIARHVVNNILDTLGNNDYVNIIKFSNITEYAVPCFGEGLVQANLANIRELKNGISEMTTERIANFTMILSYAFELLAAARNERLGSSCNQAIMLITDGVPDNYKEIFQRYNWADSPDNPEMADMPVRMFTYIIGREVADIRDSRWMACANRGYFVHLSTLAEVRDQVLNYISVMARPLVLNSTTHPTIWTQVYADIADPKITDWLWDKKERNEQKERYWIYRKNTKFMNLDDEMKAFEKRMRKHPNLAGDLYKYRLMTSVSKPVYDERDTAMRVANLLGVAGTDVPIDDIKQLMAPHMLGVHGYAFIITNNGYILTHPDLRPVFQGILRPAYNSVDMAEVELVDGDDVSRQFNEGLLQFRADVVNQKEHSDIMLTTKYHYDHRKRVGKLKRKYDSTPIKGTPFTLVVSLPYFKNNANTYVVQATKDIRREDFDKNIRAAKYFAGKNWRIHPEWLYCKSYFKGTITWKKTKYISNTQYKITPRHPYYFENVYNFSSPEEELRHFLKKATEPSWKWGTKPSEQSAQGAKKAGEESSESHYCNRDLISSLVYDASATEWFADPNGSRNDKGKEQMQRFGFVLAFVATRSGLTRWQDLPVEGLEWSDLPADHFSRLYPRAIDEVWYKRAVEQHYVQPESFVFSVPIDEDGASNSTLVTVSQAVFVESPTMKAPAAVAGFQMTHASLQAWFHNITTCQDKHCERHCGHDEVDCFLVDNHGYIVAAAKPADASLAGRFLGAVHSIVMDRLIRSGVYEKVTVFDYQAVCQRPTAETNHGSVLLTPFKAIALLASWMYGQLALTLARAGLWSLEYAEALAYPNDEIELERPSDADEPSAEAEAMAADNGNKPAAEIKEDAIYDHFVRIQRSKLEPCDQYVDLYLLSEIRANNSVYDNPEENIQGCDYLKYIVQPVNATNMILLVIDNAQCKATLQFDTLPQEVTYSINSSTLACQKSRANLERVRPQSCIRYHPKESEIKDLCGRGSSNSRLDFRLLLALGLLVHFAGSSQR